MAGLGQPNRLLLALLFLVVAVVAAAAWAMAFIGREPRDRDAHEIAVARRLSERGVMLEQQADAESRLAAIRTAWDAAGEEVEGVRRRVSGGVAATQGSKYTRILGSRFFGWLDSLRNVKR